MLLFFMISRHRRQQNPAPAQPATPPQPQPPPHRRRRKPQNPWVMSWILQRGERECYRTLLHELITTDIPGYKNFSRMEPAFFYLIEARIYPHLRKSPTNFRKPQEVGLTLAVTLRHLSTALLQEFQHECLICPTDPEDWKSTEEKFRNRWNVLHAVGALDGKHIALKKPKQSGSEYFKYKGYFSLLLLALVDAQYKFLWVNVGASGSSSDAQIFNHSKLRRKIENGTLGLPPQEPLGPGRPNLHYFFLGDDTFALVPWLVKPYSRGQLNREERVANYRISRGQRVVENAFGILLVGRFRVLLTTMEQRPKVVRDIVLTCVVLHNMLISHQGGAERSPTPADDIQPPQNDQGSKDRMKTSEIIEGGQTSTRPTERLFQQPWGTGWAGEQNLRRLRGEQAVIYQSF